MSRKVNYAYSNDVGNYDFGTDHYMKPQRYSLTTDLVIHYGLYNKMAMFNPKDATVKDMSAYHSVEYINFLKSVSGTHGNVSQKDQNKFNVFLNKDHDCPVFRGMFEFCSTYTGASLDCAKMLNNNECSIAINWSGGLHHAKKSSAYGFCFINDIVLAIMKLLETFKRVLYIDIDVHHGDGVQSAFYNTDRVMTVSFHQFEKDFFPGTGHMNETGEDAGIHCSINVPLKRGIDDGTYVDIFKNVIGRLMSSYCPSAIVIQCGADSLAQDRLGDFNLSIKGHGSCVEFVRKQNVPLLVLGGGGYIMSNVARCWAYETSILLGCDLDNRIPNGCDYLPYFDPDLVLHPILTDKSTKDYNSKLYVHKVLEHVYDNIKLAKQAPSVQINTAIEVLVIDDTDDEDVIILDSNPDVRMSTQQRDKHVEPENEYYVGDEDQDKDAIF